MLATLRQSDGAFPVVLVSTLVCLAILFWRVTLLVLCVTVVTLALYAFTLLR